MGSTSSSNDISRSTIDLRLLCVYGGRLTDASRYSCANRYSACRYSSGGFAVTKESSLLLQLCSFWCI